jgi:hypothetical protein
MPQLRLSVHCAAALLGDYEGDMGKNAGWPIIPAFSMQAVR